MPELRRLEGGPTRCKCGVFLKASQKRCKACAVDYLRQFETDRFEAQIQNEPLVLDFSQEEIDRWTTMSDSKLPPVKRNVRMWSETDFHRKNNRKMWCGIALSLVILGLVAWALVNG
jgi:hypothetical protein